jgi:hypothetical protein
MAVLWPPVAGINDVIGLIAGGRAILAGVDPYDAARWIPFATAVGQRPETAVFGYPPWIALAFAPLALLPTLAASLVWTLGTLALALAAVLAVGPRVGWPRVPTIVVAGASWPAILVLLQGQWGFALFALATFCLGALVQGRDRAAGAAFGLLGLAKPQLFFFAAVGLGAWALRERRIRVVSAALITAAAGIGLGTLAFPGWVEPYVTYVLAPRSVRSTQQPTLAGLAGDLAGPSWLALWVALVVALAIVAIAAARAASPRRRAGIAFGALLALSVAAAPYSWSYDHYLVVPLAAGTLGMTLAIPGRARAYVTAAVVVLLGPIAFALWESAYVRWHDTLAGLVPPLAIVLAWVAARMSAWTEGA